MSTLVDLLGSDLLGNDGQTVKTQETIKSGYVVGLYFSAHWCPPCRGFTPQLAEFYTNFKKEHPEKNLEMVFVSSDKDQEQFDEYFKDMPWLALPFSDRERKGQLCKKFKVQGIPTLVFLESDNCEVITTDGRNCVTEDPTGADFPWKPKPLKEILTGTLKSKAGETTVEEAINNKVVGLYFSAHWCPPCRGFTPVLATVYNKLKEQGKAFEVIFVSSDRSEESFNEYYDEMPWLSIPYGDKRKKHLSTHFKIEGIPTLVLLDENWDIIEKNGRAAVMSDQEGAKFPWHPEPLNVLDDNHAAAINEGPALIYLTDGKEEVVKKAQELMFPVAEKYVKEQKKSQKEAGGPLEELFFLYENEEGDEIADAVRSFFKLPQRSPLLFLVDCAEKRKYEFPAGEITTETIQNVVDQFKSKSLEYIPL